MVLILQLIMHKVKLKKREKLRFHLLFIKLQFTWNYLFKDRFPVRLEIKTKTSITGKMVQQKISPSVIYYTFIIILELNNTFEEEKGISIIKFQWKVQLIIS